MREGGARLLRFLYATIFLTSTGFGAAIFLLPVYAEELGASYGALGVMGAVGSAAYMVMTPVSGALLDRFERMRLYLIFSSFGVAVLLLFYAARCVSDLIALRGLLGVISAMFWVTASTLVADISPPEALTRSIGRYNVSWISGFIAGPFLGGIISDALGFRVLFVISAGLAAASVAVVWTGLMSQVTSGDGPVARRFDLSALRGLYVAYLTILPYGVVLGVYMSILPGHMKALDINPSVIGLILTLTSGVRGLVFIYAERFVAWGERRSLALASCLMGAALFLLSFSRGTPGFIVPLAMFGLSGGVITPVILSNIARRSPRHAFGTAMGVHELMYGLGMFIGPMVGGAVAEAFQPATLYLCLAALSLVILPLSRRL